MNTKLSRIIGGCFAAGCLVAGALHFATAPKAVAAVQSEWTVIDDENLFLHDLTSGPATFVAAMVLGEDGAVTAEIAHLNPVRFAPASTKVVAAKSSNHVAMETTLDRSIIMNAGEKILVAYFQTAEGLKEIHVHPGEGIAIGALPDVAANRYRWGCKCVCLSGNGDLEQAVMLCTDVFPDQNVSERCDCIDLVGTQCWFFDEDGVLIDGAMNGCKSGLLPVPKTTP